MIKQEIKNFLKSNKTLNFLPNIDELTQEILDLINSKIEPKNKEKILKSSEFKNKLKEWSNIINSNNIIELTIGKIFIIKVQIYNDNDNLFLEGIDLRLTYLSVDYIKTSDRKLNREYNIITDSLVVGLESGDFDLFITNSKQYKDYYNSLDKIKKEVEKYCKDKNIDPDYIYKKLL